MFILKSCLHLNGFKNIFKVILKSNRYYIYLYIECVSTKGYKTSLQKQFILAQL